MKHNESLVKMNQFRFWCQKVLPLVYDESLSYYEVLCKVVDYLNQLIENDTAIQQILDDQQLEINDVVSLVHDLQEEVERYADGTLIPIYVDALRNYIDENLQELVGRVVKYVVFGLSADGHFVAMIPESWNFIHFDTIVDPTSDLYGHLLVRW